MFHPTGLGLRRALVSIANDDASEAPYTFWVQGAGSGPSPNLVLLDDAMAGFVQSGAWSTSHSAQAVLGQSRVAAPGAGGGQAAWHFGGLSAGSYFVYATWAPAAHLAASAPFTVSSGPEPGITYFVDQRLSPAIALHGRQWASLGAVDVQSGSLSVSLAQAAAGAVAADAVLIVRQGTPLESIPLAHNQLLPADVSGDLRVTPQDMLMVINSLSAQSGLAALRASGAPLEASAPSAAPLSAASVTASATYQLDVNADGRVTQSDLLAVINFLLAAQARAAAPLSAPLVVAPLAAPAAAAVDKALVLLIPPTADEPRASPPLDVPSAEGMAAAVVNRHPQPLLEAKGAAPAGDKLAHEEVCLAAALDDELLALLL
jgi:hypothetical protein